MLKIAQRKKKAATEDTQSAYAKMAVGTDLTRSDFFRSLKKAAKKRDRSSQRDSEKR